MVRPRISDALNIKYFAFDIKFFEGHFRDIGKFLQFFTFGYYFLTVCLGNQAGMMLVVSSLVQVVYCCVLCVFVYDPLGYD